MKTSKRNISLIAFIISAIISLSLGFGMNSITVQAEDNSYDGFYFSSGASVGNGNIQNASIYCMKYTLYVPASIVESVPKITVSIISGEGYFSIKGNSSLTSTDGVKTNNVYKFYVKVSGTASGVREEVKVSASFISGSTTYTATSDSRSLYYIWTKINEYNDWESQSFPDYSKNTILRILDSYQKGFMEEAIGGSYFGEFKSIDSLASDNISSCIIKLKRENGNLNVKLKNSTQSINICIQESSEENTGTITITGIGTSGSVDTIYNDLLFSGNDNYYFIKFENVTNSTAILGSGFLLELSGKIYFSLAPTYDTYSEELLNSKTYLEGQINTLTTEKANLTATITEKNNSIAELNTEIESLNQTITTKTNELSAKELELTNKSNSLTTLQAQYSALNTNYDNKVTALNDLQSEYNAYKESAEIKETNYQTQVAGLQESISSLNAQILVLNNDKSLLQQNIDNKDGQISTLTTNYNSKITELNNLQEEYNQYKADKLISDTTYENRIATLEDSVSDLNAQILVLKHDKELLQQSIDNKDEEISTLTTNYNSKVEAFNNLQTEYTQYKRDKETSDANYQNQINTLNVNIQTLNNDKIALNTTITNKEEEINQLNSEIELLNDEIDTKQNRYDSLVENQSKDTVELMIYINTLEEKNKALDKLNKELSNNQVEEKEEKKDGCKANIQDSIIYIPIMLIISLFIIKRGGKNENI